VINSNEILADFQLIGNRVSNFSIDTKNMSIKSAKAQLSYDFDYNVVNVEESNNSYGGLIEFIASIKAKEKNSILFKISLKIEGAFIGNSKNLSLDEFKKMLQTNGIATLYQISRAYILSVSSLSGINPPIRLPMINVYSLLRKKQSAEMINSSDTE